jgi:hypothetical protein
MSTEIKVWQISNKQIKPVEENSLAAEHLENELENWIVQSPDILGDDLLIIGRQRNIENVGQLDLLAVNSLGELSVVELKRDMAPREAVAQALDYASWLDSTSEAEILEIAEDYLQRALDEAFAEHFKGSEMPVITPQNHKILLVCSRLDASAERIINYLAQRYAVNMNAIFFRYAKLANGAEILARSVLVAESTIQQGKPQSRKKRALELVSMAAAKKITGMVESFRVLAKDDEYVSEEAATTYGKSYRYWRKNTEGKAKMVFGVNVSGERRNTPTGQLDIWIPKHTLGRVLDLPEQQMKDLLKKLPALEMYATDNKDDCIVRLENQQAADSTAKLLQDWFEKYPGFYKSAANAGA